MRNCSIVPMLISARATELLANAAGVVEGVRAERGGEMLTFRGRHVLLTAGGYGMNAPLFQELVGFPTFVDDSYPHRQR